MTPSTKQRQEAQQREEQLIAKAISHPLRSEILTLLGKRTASPSEMQDDLPGASLEDISYHTKRLRKLKVVEVVDEGKARGWNKTRYRATVRNFVTLEDAQAVHPALADHYAGQVWREVVATMKLGAESGSLKTQEDLHLGCDDTLVLDPEGYAALNELHDATQQRAGEIVAESADRLMESGEDAIRAASIQLCFKLPDPNA